MIYTSNSRFDDKIKLQPVTEYQDHNRNKNRVWLNPSYSCNVATNIGRKILLLIDKQIPKVHKLSKVFNVNKVKVSCSSMPNFASLINSHNKNNKCI